MQPCTRRRVSWADLPLEVLRSIAQCFPKNKDEFDNFRTVCKKWWHSVTYHAVVVDHCGILPRSRKVLLFKNFDCQQCLPCMEGFSLYRLHDRGRLGRLDPGDESDEDPSFGQKFDDILCFKGKMYALDNKANLYTMSTCKGFGPYPYTSRQLFGRAASQLWRKRLVGSLYSGKVYLIMRTATIIEVFELVWLNYDWNWVCVTSFGDDQVVFVTRDNSFFARAQEFPGRQLNNCIIFSSDAFPLYSETGWEFPTQTEAKENTHFFRLGGYNSTIRPISPSFATNLWSPPPWVFQPQTSPFQTQYEREPEEDDASDLYNFRAVCNSWSRSTTISSLLPFLMNQETLFSSSVFLLRPCCSGNGSGFSPWMVSAVEITKRNMQLCHPFSGDVHVLPGLARNLDLDHFIPTRLSLEYHMADVVKNKSFSSALCCHDKVLLFSKQALPCIDDCSLLVLHNGGQLGGSPPIEPEDRMGKELPWFDISYGDVNSFDDILSFRGKIYALDRLGKIYQISINTFAVLKALVNRPFFKAGANEERKKRLVGSLLTREIYMVRRKNDMFKVYKLCKYYDSWTWVGVQKFGDDQLLFVSRVYGFFAAAIEFPGCNLSNCIIFSHDAFPPYSKIGSKVSNQSNDKEEIGVFWLGHGDNYLPISSYPGLHTVLWSPPQWVMQPHIYCVDLQCQGELKQKDEMQSSQDGASSQTKVSASPSAPNFGELTTEITSTPAARETTITLFSRSDEKHTEGPDCPGKIISVANSMDLTPSMVQLVAPVTPLVCNDGLSIEFQEINIRPELLPTLMTITAKHGPLFGDDSIRNKDILACVLESLAEMIITLQNTTGRTLTDSQADDLSSNISDLQHVGLKVEWLVPIVEKALQFRKCKPLIESVMTLDKEKSQVDERERKFLAHSAKLKQELEERKACLSAMIPFAEPMGLDECLAEGLF